MRNARPLRGLRVICLGALVWQCWWSLLPTSFSLPPATSTHEALSTRTRLTGLVTFGTSYSGKGFQEEAEGVETSLAAAGRFSAMIPEGRAKDKISAFFAAAGTSIAARAIFVARCARGGDEEATGEKKTLWQQFSVFFYIGLWYVFNIGYNIYNKKALITYPYPWACALWQMAFGFLIFVPLWITGVRKAPKLSTAECIKLFPSALGHLATHVGAVIAFFAGAVSFGHIVKASEPVVSSILNFVFMGQVMAWQVYAALVPIIAGVGIASASELSFTWLAFGAAMASNVGSAGRAVYSKKIMGAKIGENMTSANFYAVLTIMATIALIPISFAIEGPSAMLKGFHVAHAKGGSTFLLHMVASGFFYYMYNEVAFLALGKLDPVSHAVANTMKRVVIIITAVLVFKNPVTMLGVLGSGVAILGTLGYSLAKNKFS